MAEETGTLERLTGALTSALEPLAEKLASGQILATFDELGLSLPGELKTKTEFLNALGAAIGDAEDLLPLAEALVQAIEAEDAEAIVVAAAEIILKAGDLAKALDDVATELDDVADALAGVDPAEVAAFAGLLVERLLGYALIEYLYFNHPAILNLFVLAGLAEVSYGATADAADLTKPVYIRRILKLERIADWFKDPLLVLRQEYGWGEQNFDGRVLLERLANLLSSVGVPAELQEAVDDQPVTLQMMWLNLKPNKDLTPPGLDVTIDAQVAAGITIPIPLTDAWRLELSSQATLEAGIGLAITPPAAAELIAHIAVSGDVAFGVVGAPVAPAVAFPLIGTSGGTRLEAGEVRAGLLGGFRWDPGLDKGSAEVGFEGRITRGRLVIDSSSPDGFLKDVLPEGGISLDFDLTMGWSTSRGVYFSGSGGIETTFTLNLSIGPILIPMLHLRLTFSSTGTLQIEASIGVTVTIGPVVAAVDRLGALANLKFSRGNLGPVDLGVDFKPPTAIGIAVDAGPVAGGGFISFDPANSRYSGILHLEILSVSVTVIGLIETKLPDGRDGFSFLLIVCVEFSPIQLGYGFTLNGVGGLAGIHRGMNLEALRTGVYTGSLDHILFPKDPIANAPQLISDLSRIFPVAEGQFTFGPMAKIGWGADIITITLGIVIELPSPVRIALLGQIAAFLPQPEEAVVELHIDFVASIDFEAKLFALDATLRDSRIVVFTLTGDMAMRLMWGDKPNFALAMGGFHPHFAPPPGFPALRRLTLALGESDWIRLNCQTYQAITSNSVQFGARLELYVDVGVRIHGWFGFDALFIFSPFSFVVDFSAGLELSLGSIHLASITVDGSLSGPTPWRVTGSAKISILFFEVTAHVDETFGSRDAASLPQLDPWPDLLVAAEDPRNWSPTLPPGVVSVVSLAAGKADTAVLIDPTGSITWREHVAPLDRRLTRYKSAATPAPVTFTVDRITVGTTSITPPTVDDFFPAAQFEDLSDAQKLSRPSFETMHGGIEFTSASVRSGPSIPTSIVYETRLIDSATQSRSAPTFAMPLRAQIAHIAGGPAARSALRNGGPRAFGGNLKLTDSDELFEIATTDDFERRPDIAAATTKGAAFHALEAYLAEHPTEREMLQVVPAGELVAV